MRMIKARMAAALFLVVGGALLMVQCQSVPERGVRHGDEALWPDSVPTGRIDFVRDVKPLLEDQCLECHNHVDAGNFAGLNLETRNMALQSGRRAPVIIPGDPGNSLFIQVLKLNPNHSTSMPAAQEKVEGVRLAILEKWIAEGAEWPNNVRLVRPQDLPTR